MVKDPNQWHNLAKDPVYAAGIFYDRLVQVPNWETRSVVDASDVMQRSAYPERVGQHVPMAEELTAALTANSLTCTAPRSQPDEVQGSLAPIAPHTSGRRSGSKSALSPPADQPVSARLRQSGMVR